MNGNFIPETESLPKGYTVKFKIMNKVIHRAGSRAYFDHGWLKTYHTFCFGRYYDPSRVNFGALRALNDDTIEGGEGFGLHPNENMEIISIPLEGTLKHADSTAAGPTLLHPGQIQLISAGTGILHSEMNGSATQPLRLLQIWIFPDRQGLAPRYRMIDLKQIIPDELQLIAAPDDGGNEQAAHIRQQAWIYLAAIDADSFIEYRMHHEENGLYIFVIKGRLRTADEILHERDGMGVSGAGSVSLTGEQRSEILLIEVPMKW